MRPKLMEKLCNNENEASFLNFRMTYQALLFVFQGRCKSVSLDDLEEITKKRRTKPTRASAEKGRKK